MINKKSVIVCLVFTLSSCSFGGSKNDTNVSSVIIDLSHQKLYALSGKKLILESKISSGRWGYQTPTGEFKVIYKNKNHVSNAYPKREWDENGGAKMPYTVKFTRFGNAIHAGEIPGYPDSHGCVRIPYGKAMQLFKMVSYKTDIIVQGKTPLDDRVNRMRKKLGKEKNKEFEDGYRFGKDYLSNNDKFEIKVTVDRRVEKSLRYLNDM